MIRMVQSTIVFLFLTASSFGQSTNCGLEISRITGDFYVYTTCGSFGGKPFPANGMYLVTNKGVVLFDSPWDTTEFQPLLDSIQKRHNKKVIICIATHFHDDRTAGLAYFRAQGIKTYTSRKTDELSRVKNKKRAEFLIDRDTLFTVGEYSFQTYFPGEGHTADNIVIWFEKEKILYGGCLVKSTEADNLGNLEDANIKEYARTIERLQAKCQRPKYVIPGHQDWRSPKSLQHTLDLARQALKKTEPVLAQRHCK